MPATQRVDPRPARPGDGDVTDPLPLLAADRQRARELADPWANLCALATVAASGAPAVRVLVLRDLGSRLSVFVNGTSPKVAEFASAQTVAALVYLPTLGIQYRLQCALEPLEPTLVRDAWLQRPAMPKQLDWFYAAHPQSSAFESRAALLDAVAHHPLPDPLTAPESALGFALLPCEVERLELAEGDALHDRRRYALQGEVWQESALVP